MCQMPNIWHIYHTNHQKPSLSDIPNAIIFATYKQCRCIFATVRTKMVYWLIFFYSLLSLFSLFSLFFSLLSHLCSLSPILVSITFVIVNPSSPISPGIVIIIADRNRRGHRCWGEIGVFVTTVGINAEILIVGIDVEVRWDLDRGSPVLVGLSWSKCFLGLS